MKLIITIIIITDYYSCFAQTNTCIPSHEIKDGRVINQIDENCVKHGYWDKQYNVNGLLLRIQGYYDKGKKEGIWLTRNTDGELYSKTKYKSDILLKEWIAQNDELELAINHSFLYYIIERYSDYWISVFLISFSIKVFLIITVLMKINNTTFPLFPWLGHFWTYTPESWFRFHYKIRKDDPLLIRKKSANIFSRISLAIIIFVGSIRIIDWIINYGR